MTLVTTANLILSSLTVAGQVVITLGIILLITHQTKVLGFINKNSLLISFAAVLIATLGSLFYSEIAGYEPCELCWFQRVLMYPQLFLFGIALWKHDRNIRDYAIGLSGIGTLIAGYHYLLQLGIAPSLPCSAVGYSVSCSRVFVMNFGYITMPMMALTAFVLILLVQIINRPIEQTL